MRLQVVANLWKDNLIFVILFRFCRIWPIMCCLLKRNTWNRSTASFKRTLIRRESKSVSFTRYNHLFSRFFHKKLHLGLKCHEMTSFPALPPLFAPKVNLSAWRYDFLCVKNSIFFFGGQISTILSWTNRTWNLDLGATVQYPLYISQLDTLHVSVNGGRVLTHVELKNRSD